MSEQTNIFIDGPSGAIEAVITKPDKDMDSSVRWNDGGGMVGIICHPHPLHQGTMNNKVVVTTAKAFTECGAMTVRFNFRGVGKSAGTYGQMQGEIEDLTVVIDWVKQTQHPKGIWLAGFSFGSYISAAYAAQTQDPLITHLISLAPPANSYPFASLPAPSCPWLIIYGDKDELTPDILVETWAATLPASAKLIKFVDCTHFFHGHLIELKHTLVDWLQTS